MKHGKQPRFDLDRWEGYELSVWEVLGSISNTKRKEGRKGEGRTENE